MKTKPIIKWPFISAAVLLGAVSPLAGQDPVTLTYEGFDIPPGEIDFTSGETSWGWKRDQSGEQLTWWAWDQPTNDFYHAVSDGGLEYPGLSSIGNAFEFLEETYNETNLNWVYRLLPRFYSYDSSGQLWLSALFNPKITGDPGGGGWFQLCLSDFHNAVYLGLSNSTDQSVWSAGGERLKLDGVSGEKWAYSEVPVIDGETVFLVMHLDFDNKTAAFYANPPVDADDPGTPVAEFTMWSDMWFDKVMMWSVNAGPSVEGEGADYIGSRIDEIRLGTTYASVAGGADLEDPGTGELDLDPPLITGPSGSAGSASSSKTIPENTVQVATMEANEAVAWSISGGLDKAFFTIGVGTGGLSFKTFPDYENPLDGNTDNTYIVQVQAMDTAGNTSTQVVLVTVADVEDEIPPVITGLSGEPGAEESTAAVNENESLVGTYTASEAAAWDISGGADETAFIIGADSGQLSFVSAPDFEAPTDADTNNIYEVEIRATDASGNASRQLVLVTVTDLVNEVAMWAHWPIGAEGWVDTSAGGGKFAGWVKVDAAPWIYSLALNKYLYMSESYVSAFGAWAYVGPGAGMSGSPAGEWSFWNPDPLGWIDSSGFLGWINVTASPWVYSLAMENSYIYLAEENITASGSWIYIFLKLPDAG